MAKIVTEVETAAVAEVVAEIETAAAVAEIGAEVVAEIEAAAVAEIAEVVAEVEATAIAEIETAAAVAEIEAADGSTSRDEARNSRAHNRRDRRSKRRPHCFSAANNGTGRTVWHRECRRARQHHSDMETIKGAR